MDFLDYLAFNTQPDLITICIIFFVCSNHFIPAMNELEASEILFAQKLSSGEPATRRLAFKKLSTWFRTHCRQSSTEQQKSTLNRDDMLRIWKGLYMAVWMQDKAILQEELADSIGALIDVIECNRQAALFVEIMLITLSREWSTIDRWRLDKFLMVRWLRKFAYFLYQLGDRFVCSAYASMLTCLIYASASQQMATANNRSNFRCIQTYGADRW
jgi:hypothetical protein